MKTKQTEPINPNQFFDPVRLFKKMKFRVCYAVFIFLLTASIGLSIKSFSILTLSYIIIEGYFITKQSTYNILKSCALTSVIMFVLLILYTYLGTLGIIGFILIYIMLISFILYSNRKLYLNGMRSIETRIWKKPLDKKYWKEGELKNTKLKLVWSKIK